MVAKAIPVNGSAHPGPPREILVIDANEDHQTLSAIALGRRGFKVTAVASGAEGLRLALSHSFDAIVLDHKVRDLGALEVLQGLVRRLPQTPKIFVVAPGTEDQAVKAMSVGATGYLVKTARYNEVLSVEVEDQIEKARTKARLAEQSRTIEQGIAEREKAEEALRAFEERVGVMSEQAPFILWTMDPTLHFTSSVGSGLRSIGLKPNEVTGLSLQEFAQSEDPNLPLIAAHRRALAGETARFEQEWQGRIFDVHVEPLQKKDGPILGVFGVALDVTERVRAERIQSALYRISQAASSTDQLEDVLRFIHGIVGELMPARNFYIALHDPEANTLTFPYFVDEAENPPGPQPVGRGLTEYVLRTGKPILASPEVFQQLLDSGEVEQIGPPSIDWLGVPLIVKDRVFGVLVVQSYTEGVRYTEAEKDLLRFVCTQIAMVVDRKRAEDSLRQSEHALSAMLSHLPGVAYRTRYDETWTNEFVSEGCFEIFGYRREDLQNNRKISGLDLIHPDDRRWVRQETEAAVEEHRPYRIHYRIRTASGAEKWVWDQGHAICRPDGKVVALEGLVTDVTEWKSVVDGLRNMGIFRALFDSATDPILLVDRNGRVFDANPMAEALLAKERGVLVGKAVEELVLVEPRGTLPRRLEDLFQDRLREDSWEATLRDPANTRRRVRLYARIVREAGADPLAELSLRDAGRGAGAGSRTGIERIGPPRA
jgi:PAS domain S-box-containing protein